MAPELFALRRLADVYRRVLLLAVPAALAGCQDAGDSLGPSSDTGVEPVALAVAGSAAFSTPRIAFTSYGSGAGDIYWTNSSGAAPTRLTTSSALEQAPAWSWDNKRIALVRPRKDNSDVLHQDIYIINADGTAGHWARPYASTWLVTSPSWSPDGKRIVVVVGIGGTGYLGYIDVATGSVTLLGGGIPGSDPSYDPTGTKIAYVTFASSLDQINADGTGHKLLLKGSGMAHPTWAPDGKRIAFNQQVNYDQELFVKNLADGTLKRLTTSKDADVWATWSPDGGKIAFSSFRSGKWQIWIMPSAGGSATRITHTSVTEQMAAFSH